MATSAARLEVVAGNAAGMSILVDDELVIGRHADGPGRLADDEEISRLHARVSLDAGRFLAIEDLGSTNGTFVNGLRISSPQVLSEGDTIEIGQTTLAVGELPSATTEPGRDSDLYSEQPTFVPPPAPEVLALAGEGPLPAVDPAPAELPPVAPEPVPDPPVAPEPSLSPEPPAPLSLQLKVDFVTREASLYLDERAEPVRLVLDAGSWRFVPSPPSEQGGPA